jgi:hypothetical protein
MPRGPKGEKRPADVVGAAVMVGRIATGDVTEKFEGNSESSAATLERRGGRARAAKLSSQRRRAIAKQTQKSRRPCRNRRALPFPHTMQFGASIVWGVEPAVKVTRPESSPASATVEVYARARSPWYGSPVVGMICRPTIAMGNFVPTVSRNGRLFIVR